ncbi:MAG: phosphodiester glycosidase family protein [Polyangiales bacterium]
MRRIVFALLFVLFTFNAAAQDVWTTPYPGVRMLQRRTSQPVVLWALVIDSCAAGIRFRATAPSEGPRVTSSFGRLVGAQIAINGDFADHDFGLNVGNGMAWPSPDTDHSGNISIGPSRIEMTPDHVVLPAPAPWVTEQLGGRWTLLEDGVPQLGIDDNGPASGGFVCAPGLRHPRTAIGLSRDRRNVILVVADGRTSASIGMTCDELIALFQALGAHDAMGLDGGGSSTLWMNNAVVNHPTDATGERVVRNHLAIFAAGTGPSPHCGMRATVTEPPMATPVSGATPPTVTALTAPSRFTTMTPTRLFDTRTPEDSARLLRSDGSTAGPLSRASSGAFGAWADVGAPRDATAAWINLTAVGLVTPGYITVFPHGRTRPETSNVNYGPGQIIANAAPVALGTSSQIDIDAIAEVDVIADLAGTFGPSGAGLSPITPTRVLDTRTPAMPLMAGVARSVDVRAPTGATGVVASVAVIARGTPGFLTAAPCGVPRPNTSNVNFAASDVVANAVVSGLGGGRLCLTSSVDTDVVVDVTGYLTPTAPLSYVPLHPQRFLDTRSNTTLYTNRVAERQVVEIPIQRAPGMPPSVGAVVANVTVVGAAAPGFVTTFPCGATPPEASALNFPADRAVGALTITAVGRGSLCLFASARTHVIVDVLGVWVAPPATPDAGVPDVMIAPDVPAVTDASIARDVTMVSDVTMPPDVTAPRDVPLSDVTLSDVTLSDVTANDVTASDASDDTGDLETRPAGGTCGCRASNPDARGSLLVFAALAALASRRRRR